MEALAQLDVILENVQLNKTQNSVPVVQLLDVWKYTENWPLLDQ